MLPRKCVAFWKVCICVLPYKFTFYSEHRNGILHLCVCMCVCCVYALCIKENIVEQCAVGLASFPGSPCQGCREDWRDPGQIQKVGPGNMNCARGVWGMPPGNFLSLHALKWVLGAPEVLFRACTQYICTCKLPSSTLCVVSNFRSKSTTYGALAKLILKFASAA